MNFNWTLIYRCYYTKRNLSFPIYPDFHSILQFHAYHWVEFKRKIRGELSQKESQLIFFSRIALYEFFSCSIVFAWNSHTQNHFLLYSFRSSLEDWKIGKTLQGIVNWYNELEKWFSSEKLILFVGFSRSAILCLSHNDCLTLQQRDFTSVKKGGMDSNKCKIHCVQMDCINIEKSKSTYIEDIHKFVIEWCCQYFLLLLTSFLPHLSVHASSVQKANMLFLCENRM